MPAADTQQILTQVPPPPPPGSSKMPAHALLHIQTLYISRHRGSSLDEKFVLLDYIFRN